MESFTFVSKDDFKEDKLSKTGIWIIYEGSEDKITLILTELSQSVVGANFGIFKDSTNNKIKLYKAGSLIETYNNEINKHNLLYWCLRNSM